jgi:alpha-tubulin suppressor-like RCC1 family protein
MSDIDYFSFVPKEIIIQIALNLTANQVKLLFCVNKYIGEIVNVNYFWKQRYYLDFGKIDYEGNWKELYMSNKINILGVLPNCRDDSIYNYKLTEINHRAKQISVGTYHAAFIDLNDKLWMNSIGSTANRFTNTMLDVRQVSVGHNYVMIIDSNDDVWGYGANYYGELGIDSSSSVSFKLIQGNIKAKQVSAGLSYTMIIDIYNNIWATGYDEFGQFGLGINHTTIPIQIHNLKVKHVSVGYNHTLIIDMDNNVLSIGNNNYGQLGLGNQQLIGSITTFTPISNIKAKQISASDEFSAIIDFDDNILTFGHNNWGQLGLGDNIDRYEPTKILNIKAKEVSTGQDHMMIIDLYGYVWAVGKCTRGELGLENKHKSVNTLTQIKNIKATKISIGDTLSLIV